MIATILVLAPFIYCLFWNILDKASHFGYAYKIAKNEGIGSYIGALWWSYYLPDKYFVLLESKKYIYDLEKLSFIELVCRNSCNAVKGYSITKDEIRSVVSFVAPYQKMDLHFEEGAIYTKYGDNLLIPPYYVRLIEIITNNNSKDIDILKL